MVKVANLSEIWLPFYIVLCEIVPHNKLLGYTKAQPRRARG